MGSIIIAAVAIVATVMTAGAMLPQCFSSLGAMMSAGATALGTNLGIALAAGAIGSIASQTVGIAIGVQSEFSWSGVAMGAIGAGVSAGLGATGMNLIARAAVGSMITQGVAVATGLQEEFSWAGVAASAVGAGVGQAVGRIDFGDNTFARDLTVGLASGVARQLVYGGKANWANVAADAFGNAIGNSLAYQSNSANSSSQETVLSQAENTAWTSERQAALDNWLVNNAGKGISDSDYPTTTQAERYAQTYGGETRNAVMNPGDEGEFMDVADRSTTRIRNASGHTETAELKDGRLVITATRNKGVEGSALGQCTPNNPYGLPAYEKAVADYVIQNPLSGGVSLADLNQYQMQYIEEGVGNRIAIQNAQANSPSLTSGESFTLSPAEHPRWYVATRSSFNMLGASAGVVQGLAVAGLGLGVSSTPASPVGWVLTAGGIAHAGKNVADFSLNAANLWKATVGSGGYFEDSFAEQIVDWSGGSKVDKQWAAAANLGYDLGTMKVTNLPGFTYDYGKAARLQAPYKPNGTYFSPMTLKSLA
ncbi:MAG: hypothetical protein U1A72_04160, partial [Sulfuritalea sp.]|nr:hypothetical protein [Sulfuritalea sp.]